MKNADEKLKPRPFCGEDAAKDTSHSSCDCCGKAFTGCVDCQSCGAGVSHYDTAEEVKNAWNQRLPVAALPPEIAEFVKKLDGIGKGDFEITGNVSFVAPLGEDAVKKIAILWIRSLDQFKGTDVVLDDVNCAEEAMEFADSVLRTIRQSQWRPISEAPKGLSILVHYKNALGKGRTVKAIYIERFTEEANEEYENFEYCEERDAYLANEGWYETIDNWPDYTSVAITEGVPYIWQPLPTPPAAE